MFFIFYKRNRGILPLVFVELFPWHRFLNWYLILNMFEDGHCRSAVELRPIGARAMLLGWFPLGNHLPALVFFFLFSIKILKLEKLYESTFFLRVTHNIRIIICLSNRITYLFQSGGVMFSPLGRLRVAQAVRKQVHTYYIGISLCIFIYNIYDCKVSSKSI